MEQQRFENTFFSLLRLLNSIIDSMELTLNFKGRPTQYNGRECFAALYGHFQHQYIAAMQRASPNTDLSALSITVYEQQAGLVGHYFRTLHSIVMFVDTSDMDNKQTYINILRSQLSSSELSLLFYNCLSKYVNETFKPLVEKYGILENLDSSTLISGGHKELYSQYAFQCHFQPPKE